MKFFSAGCRPDDNPQPRSPLRLRARVTSHGGPEGSGVGTLSLFACQLPACSDRVRWPHETNLWREGTRGSERLRGINMDAQEAKRTATWMTVNLRDRSRDQQD